MESKDLPIGVFDTGVGGLTVVKEIMRQLPRERILYFGDTARMPYGQRPSHEIVQFSLECLRFLEQEGVKFLLVACNTVSAFLDALSPQLNVPVMGVIKAGALSAVKTTKGGPIGVIATEGTVNSGAYTTAIHELRKEIEVIYQAAPKLALMAEDGCTNHDDLRAILTSYLKPLLERNIDTLVLGCTHYPLFQDKICEIVGPRVQIVNPASQTVRQLSAILKESGLESHGSTDSNHFFVSGNQQKFTTIAKGFLDCPIESITKFPL